jgi:hypothetical protein
MMRTKTIQRLWVALVAVLQLAGCAASRSGDDASAFDDSFDPSWMMVIPVDRATLPGFCLRDDRQHLMGCARPFHDRTAGIALADHQTVQADRLAAGLAAGRVSCVIYVAKDLMRDAAAFDQVLRHEAKHCRGWRHPGD